MSISPMTALGLARMAGPVIQELASLPRVLLSLGGKSSEAETKAAVLSLSGAKEAQQSTSEEAGRAKAAEQIAEVAGEIAAFFSLHGVDLSSEVVLGMDDGGHIEVQGDHPAKAEIEALLALDPELTAQFEALSSAMNEGRHCARQGPHPAMPNSGWRSGRPVSGDSSLPNRRG